MKTLLFLFIVLVGSTTYASEWVFLPSYYSQNAVGNRVSQYAQPEPSYRSSGSVSTSGLRINNSYINTRTGCEYSSFRESWTSE